MKSIYLRRALSLAMMPFSNAQYPVLYLILCLWSLGLTLRPIALVLVFWVKIVVGIFFSVNSIKDIYPQSAASHCPLIFQFQVSDTRLTSCARALLGATTLSLNAPYQASCPTLSVLIHGLILKQIILDPPHWILVTFGIFIWTGYSSVKEYESFSSRSIYSTKCRFFIFQWQCRDMRLTFSPRALSLAMMRYLSVPFQALSRISCMWILGSTQRQTLWSLSLMVLKMCLSKTVTWHWQC